MFSSSTFLLGPGIVAHTASWILQIPENLLNDVSDLDLGICFFFFCVENMDVGNFDSNM